MAMRTVLFILGGLLAISTAGIAQLSLPQDTLDYAPPRNMIVVNPGGIAVDYVGLAYYHAFTGNHAFGVFGHYIYRPVGDKAAEGITAGIAYRYHPAGKANWRFHYGPLVGYQTIHVADNRNNTAGGIFTGFAVGWQWLPERGFAVGFGIGESYVARLGDNQDAVINSVFGFRTLLSVELGYAW
jgi:hypothetical protein